MVSVGDSVLYMPDQCYWPHFDKVIEKEVGGERDRNGKPLWNVPWPAVVTAVYEDGSADLDISYPDQTGVTLNYDRRKQSDKKQPATWHVA